MARTTGLGAGTAPARRWPWALAATVAGAVAGTAVAYAVRRVQGQDRPGAVEPDQVRAVVDRADDDVRPPA
jgi:outer membrane lipoprotein SlyB